MKSAVIGGGISGLVAALELSKAGAEVTLYEKKDYLARSDIDLKLSFMVLNAQDQNTMEFFESINVDLEEKEMSFSLSLDNGEGYEWGTRNGLSSLFAQKCNGFSPYFLRMIRETFKFKDETLRYLKELEGNSGTNRDEKLGHFLKTRGYSKLFQTAYIIPLCASVWACSFEKVLSFSAYSVLSFFHNHHLLEPLGPSQGHVVSGGGQKLAAKIIEQLMSKGCQIKSSFQVHSVTTTQEGCVVTYGDDTREIYDECIMAVNTRDALKLLAKEATYDESRILGAFQYESKDVFIHRDKSFMPRNSAAWSTWNFVETNKNEVGVTFWLNPLENIDDKISPYLVSLNPSHAPNNTVNKCVTRFRLPTIAAAKASLELKNIQGKRGIWFCGPYQEYYMDEDKVKAGLITAHYALGKSSILMTKLTKNMAPSWTEASSRRLVIRFLNQFINTGCLILFEEGGKTLTFQGKNKKCPLKTSLRIHNPCFYWKVATQADLGLADAYVQGDFSMVDENEGLVTLLMICIANRNLEVSQTKLRGWWTPYLYTAVLGSAIFYIKHLMRQNTLTQARRNVSRHYDLSNEMFKLFLDDTMTYSCAVFKSDDDDLKVAQLRKINLLIQKAKIEKQHEVLEIGCGWGGFAIEVVKKTGCKYTGLTLSEEQLKFAEAKVKECGLQDRIRFLLCDYRQLSNTFKYDRIVSCEMIEHVGHEYFEEFFGFCESVMAEDGLLVLQFQAVPDTQYDMFRKSPSFASEYIFPGGVLPSVNRLTSAMAASSRLCVEHLENIGSHYFPTLRQWRKNFLEQQSKIIALGFDQKFIRTWEYYFDFFAAGQKYRALETYQMVFSRPGNLTAFADPYKGFLTAD